MFSETLSKLTFTGIKSFGNPPAKSILTFKPKVNWVQFIRVAVPEITSDEQRGFIIWMFFSADSETMENVNADQLWNRNGHLWFILNQRWSELKNSTLFQSWTALFQRERALNQRCSALIFLALKHWFFSTEQRWFSADLLKISSDINKCR